MLMQTMPEDEDGNVPYQEFATALYELRAASMQNALVETDLASLRKHLILLLRRRGLDANAELTPWTLKKVLLAADQLCLSRLQIHLLLCMATKPNMRGVVDCYEFLRLCCSLIPHLFNAAAFNTTAARLETEKADAARKAEMAELEAMTGPSIGRAAGAQGRGEEEDADGGGAGEGMDQEQVEKTLVHLFSVLDESHRGVLPVETMFKVLRSADPQVASCQLTEKEICGFVAEMNVDENVIPNTVAYVDHVKTWVPVIFELRRNAIYERLLSAFGGDVGAAGEGMDTPERQVSAASNSSKGNRRGSLGDVPVLVDLSELEAQFPLVPPELVPIGAGRRGSGERNSKDRPPEGSKERRQGSKEPGLVRQASGTQLVRQGSKSGLVMSKGRRPSLVADGENSPDQPSGAHRRPSLVRVSRKQSTMLQSASHGLPKLARPRGDSKEEAYEESDEEGSRRRGSRRPSKEDGSPASPEPASHESSISRPAGGNRGLERRRAMGLLRGKELDEMRRSSKELPRLPSKDRPSPT